MKSILLAVLLLMVPWVAKSAMAETATQCYGTAVPSGWAATDFFYDPSQCNTPYPPFLGQANVLTITRINNLPIGSGSLLHVCSAAYTPADGTAQGYSTGPWEYYGPACSCPYSGTCEPLFKNSYTIQHVTCVSGQTNCYSPGVYASSSQVTAPYGQMYGTVNASWNSPDTRQACVWVKSTYGSTVQTAFWRCGVTGSNIPWSWVRVGGTTQFLLSMSSTSSTPTIATTGPITAVQGAQPTLTATPSHVIVPVGQNSGSYTLAWTAPGYPAVDMWGRINNTGAWNGPVGVVPSGSSVETFTVGTTHTWRSYAPGSAGPNSAQPTAGFLKEATTYASH